MLFYSCRNISQIEMQIASFPGLSLNFPTSTPPPAMINVMRYFGLRLGKILVKNPRFSSALFSGHICKCIKATGFFVHYFRTVDWFPITFFFVKLFIDFCYVIPKTAKHIRRLPNRKFTWEVFTNAHS